jgi:GntR family transcriptional regulator, galactonate operon transcriptional repressor
MFQVGHLRTMHDTVVDRIATWIVQGRFPSGSLLPTEPDLGEELGVSRTVVREAVKALSAKGMVEPKKRVGTRILPTIRWHLFDPAVVGWILDGPRRIEQIRDMIEIRLAIEPFAAELAATRRTSEDLAAVQTAYRNMEIALENGGSSYNDADIDFHVRVLLASGNRYLLQMRPVIEVVLRLAFTANNISIARARRSLPYHVAVLDAVGRSDSAAARQAMEVIIRFAGHEIMGDLEVAAIESTQSAKSASR